MGPKRQRGLLQGLIKRFKAPREVQEIAVEIKVENSSEKCSFCQRSKLSGTELEQGGKFYRLGPHFFHFFCVLFR